MAAAAGFLGGLVAAAAPMAIKALSALGFSTITYIGVTAVTAQLVALAQANWSAMPSGVLQIATLSGIPQGLAMVFGAYAALFAIQAAAGFKRFIVK